MRKYILFLTAILLLGTACTNGEKSKKERERKIPTYTIGLNLPLTGSASYLAEEFRKGFELSFDHFNDSSRRLIIEVLYEDNKFNPKDAVTICKKFIDINKVDIYIAGYTPIIQATIGIVNRSEIPSLMTMSSSELIAAPYEWAFRDFALESNSMPLIASYAYSGMGHDKGTWLVVNDDMGLDALKYFSNSFVESGGSMLEGEVFENTETDLRNKINKLLDHQPGFIVVVGRGSAMINALRQIREKAPDLPLFCSMTVENEQVWNALGDKADNIYFPQTYVDRGSRMYKKVSERFILKHGYEMNWLNIFGVSTASYLIHGLKKTKGDKEALKEFLRNLDVQSIRGRLVMNENSDVIIPHIVYVRSGGQSLPVNWQGVE